MKLKEFFFSTLPRSRKSKRKQSKNTPSPSSGSTSNPENDDVIVHNQRSHIDVVNGNSKKKKNKKPEVACSAPVSHTLPHNRNLVSSDFLYYSDRNGYPYSSSYTNQYVNPYGHQTLAKTPSNASESGFEDGQDPVCGQFESYRTNTDSSHSITPDIVACNTFPRERTRIKTNPWVTTHTNTMTSSIHGQVTDTRPRGRSPYSVNLSSIMDYNRNASGMDYTSRSRPHSSSSNSSAYADSSIPPSPEISCSMYSSTGAQTCFDDDHTYYDDVTGQAYYDDANSSQEGVLEGNDLVINLNTGDIFVKPKQVQAPVSFQYEEDLDATLERDSSRRKAKSRRKRDEESCYYLRQEDLYGYADGSDKESDAGDEFVVQFGETYTAHYDSDNDADRESTLTRDGYSQYRTRPTSGSGSLRKRGTKGRKYRMDAVLRGGSPANEVYSPYKAVQYEASAVVDKFPNACAHNKDMSSLQPSLHRELSDSAYESSTLSSLAGSSLFAGFDPSDHRQRPTTLPGFRQRKHKQVKSDRSTQRSLEEIHCSLREKVDRLRMEKRLVDEKIQQAREEEQFRREEKARIEQEVTSIRRQVLLQTLQDLKDNLSGQSQRLQNAYDDVLDMQWLNARLRRLRNTTL